jgi:Uma2 family endonuclease
MVVSAPRKLTYDDFVRIPEDGRRHEILDGEHVVTAAPFLRHQQVVVELSGQLYVYLKRHNLGRMFTAPADVVLSRHDVVEPDLLFVSNAKLGLLTQKNVQGAPDLVVEVLSPGTRHRDLGKKRVRYELLGVGEYWVLDPDRDTATVLRRATPDSTAFEPPIELSAEADDPLTTPLLPGLEIPLREVFAR